MIPADIASRLKLVVPDQPTAPQPLNPVKNLGDVLSDLVPGQRIMAEIQALLPNGTYRALVAQREITLALPFSAKSGDSLELEVVETNGKTALALVSNRSATSQTTVPQDSVATTLSQTGKLIGNLLGGIDDQGKRAAPAPLNGNLPLVKDFPANAADLAPILKEAISKSGVFYEAHQARWVAGELPTEQLLKEPQGKHSNLAPPLSFDSALPRTPTEATDTARLVSNTGAGSDLPASALAKSPSGQIPPELAPIVQQQLDALATQTYVWQGQIWPGQQMSWEINEQAGKNQGTDDGNGHWQTRLKLKLPHLGDIDASLRLRTSNEVEIALSTQSKHSENSLDAAAANLKQQFEAAGLKLTQLTIKHGTEAP
jgi:hypothetical protein